MTEEISFELRTQDRPNRFQVNPVNSMRLHQTDDDAHDDDTFPDEDITLRNTKRRSSRYA